MNYDHLNFLDAIEQLASQAGMQVPNSGIKADPGLQTLFELLNKAEQLYQTQLFTHSTAKPAQQYLKKRGLSLETIKRFKLGYALEGWDNLLKTLGEKNGDLLRSGLLVENDKGRRYDRFRNRVIFPIHDRRGRTIGFGGRVMDDSLPKYLNSPETPVFHKGQELYGLYEARQACKNLHTLVVVEGYMDVISLAQHGVDYAVATLGTAITENHARRLLSTCKQIVFCFDGDNAGRKAAWKALEVTLPQLTEQADIKFIFMPQGEDPDTYIKENSQEAFEALIEAAPSLSAFLFDHLSESVNLESLDGRAKLISLAMPFLQTVKAPIIKDLLISELAQLTHTDSSKILNWSNTLNNNSPSNSISQQAAPNSGKRTPVRSAITLLLQFPKAAAHVTSTLPQVNLPGIKLLTELLEITQSNPQISTGALLEHWRNKPEAKHLAKLASEKLLTPETGAATELEDIFKQIAISAIEQEIEQLLHKSKQTALTDEEKRKLQALFSQKAR